jgi:hypothetical protein
MKTKTHPLIREIQLGRTVEEVVDEHLLPDYDLHGCYGEGADLYDIVREVVRLNKKWLRFAVETGPGSCNIIVLNDSSDLSMSYWDDDYEFALSDNAEADCQTLNDIVERIYGTKRKKPKPKMSQEEFAAKEGENCPYCGRDAIVLDKVTWNDRDIMGCGGCGETWFRRHKKVVTGFE